MLPVLALYALVQAASPADARRDAAAPAAATPFPYVTPAPLPGAATPTPSPVPTPVPVYTALFGVTLGDSRAAASKALGKPLEVVPVNVGEMWRWSADGGNAQLAVVFANDAAMSVTFSPNNGKKSTLQDPYGVALGITVDQLTSLRGQALTVSDNGNRVYGNLSGVRWVYGFDNGALTDIDISEPLQSVAPPPPASLDTSGGRDGANMARAVIVKAATASAGIDLEYAYIKGLTCGQGGSWGIVTQTTVAVAERWYDEFDVLCSSDRSTNVLYFDVTSYTGK